MISGLHRQLDKPKSCSPKLGTWLTYYNNSIQKTWSMINHLSTQHAPQRDYFRQSSDHMETARKWYEEVSFIRQEVSFFLQLLEQSKTNSKDQRQQAVSSLMRNLQQFGKLRLQPMVNSIRSYKLDLMHTSMESLHRRAMHDKLDNDYHQLLRAYRELKDDIFRQADDLVFVRIW